MNPAARDAMMGLLLGLRARGRPSLAWAVEHAPAGDLDAVIARLWAALPVQQVTVIASWVYEARGDGAAVDRLYDAKRARLASCSCVYEEDGWRGRSRYLSSACRACADALRAHVGAPPTYAQLRAALWRERAA